MAGEYAGKFSASLHQLGVWDSKAKGNTMSEMLTSRLRPQLCLAPVFSTHHSSSVLAGPRIRRKFSVCASSSQSSQDSYDELSRELSTYSDPSRMIKLQQHLELMWKVSKVQKLGKRVYCIILLHNHCSGLTTALLDCR